MSLSFVTHNRSIDSEYQAIAIGIRWMSIPFGVCSPKRLHGWSCWSSSQKRAHLSARRYKYPIPMRDQIVTLINQLYALQSFTWISFAFIYLPDFSMYARMSVTLSQECFMCIWLFVFFSTTKYIRLLLITLCGFSYQ